jgi:hypothetical protein
VDGRDPVGDDGEFPVIGVVGLVDQAQVQRGTAAVTSDIRHVVFLGAHQLRTDPFGPVDQLAHIVGEVA